MQRRQLKGSAGFALAVFILALSLPSMGRAQARNELRIALIADVSTIDPAFAQSASEQAVMGNIYSNLIRFKPGTSQIEPDVATKWEVSSDGRTYTFQLRRGVQWHKNFGELTSADVKFTIERHLDRATRSRYRSDYENVESVQTPDPYTVRIILRRPQPGFLITAIAYRPGWIVSEKAVKQYGADYGFNPVGTGPFEFERYEKGSRTVLRAFRSYFEGPAKIARVTFTVIPDPAVSLAALQAGNLDILPIRNAEVFKQAKADKSLVVVTRPSMSVRSLYLNTLRGPLQDKRVRQAVSHAIDRAAIVKFVLEGTGQVADSALPPPTFAYTRIVPLYKYDPERAKRILNEAGLAGGVALEFVYPREEPYQSIAPAVKDQLERAGLRINMIGLERVAWNDRANKGDFDLTSQGLTRPPDPDVYFTTGYHSANARPGANYPGYSAIDREIEEARVEVDVEKRKQMYVAMQRRVAEDVPVVPIYYAYAISALRPYVKGYVEGILNEIVLHRVTVSNP